MIKGFSPTSSFDIASTFVLASAPPPPGGSINLPCTAPVCFLIPPIPSDSADIFVFFGSTLNLPCFLFILLNSVDTNSTSPLSTFFPLSTADKNSLIALL